MPFLRRVLVTICSTAVGRGIVFAFRLDRFVADMIQTVMTPEWREAIAWMLAGALGLIGLGLWEFAPKLIRKAASTKREIPVTTASTRSTSNIRPLAILIGSGPEFERVERVGAALRRTITVQVKNDGPDHLSRCRFQLLRVTPDPPRHQGP
jgi:hypothetical protein